MLDSGSKVFLLLSLCDCGSCCDYIISRRRLALLPLFVLNGLGFTVFDEFISVLCNSPSSKVNLTSENYRLLSYQSRLNFWSLWLLSCGRLSFFYKISTAFLSIVTFLFLRPFSTRSTNSSAETIFYSKDGSLIYTRFRMLASIRSYIWRPHSCRQFARTVSGKLNSFWLAIFF